MNPERRYLAEQVTRVEGEQPNISGLAAVFYDGSERTQYELWPGLVERILPGTFADAITGDDVRGLFNHDPDNILGRNTAKTLTLSENTQGLVYTINPPDTELGRQVVESIRRGDVTGSSFAFRVLSETWAREDGLDVREIRKVKLYDVGPVTFPAYTATTTGLRCWHNDSDVEAIRKSQYASRRFFIQNRNTKRVQFIGSFS